ncbi:hypothetical protein DPMN_117835 [Dreissena polymorpha]|uniref:Uncharacterized protein n=1 Tax=Dreissena polymorpha TaxID=45954 RepID=A0A9D4JL48_DREPO|nr:hypothetical protein DPMN_117835 [Dreissena polymorpha]
MSAGFEPAREDPKNLSRVGNFHEDLTINMTSRVITRKTAPPPGGKLPPPWRPSNVPTKFHVDWNINVTSRVKPAAPHGGHTSRVHIKKTAPPPGRHNIIDSNILTKLHEDWTINVTIRVLKRKTDPSPGRHVYIIGTNTWTKFHENWTLNKLEKTAPPLGGHVF